MNSANTALIEDQAVELIDLDFYTSQARSKFTEKNDALRHFIETGQESNLMPHPLFHTEWYKWQNPGYTNHISVLHEFLARSKNHIVDPSPMLDMVQFMKRSGSKDPVSAINAAKNKKWCTGDGVYRDYGDLVDCQKKLRESLVMKVLRALPPANSRKRRKNLLWVQIGPDSEFVKWFKKGRARNWDLLLNWYSPDQIDYSIGDGALLQRGTKFSAVAEVWKTRPDIFDEYQSAMFFDDDLIIRYEQVDKIFDSVENYKLDVFQPALTENSHGVWPVFRQKSSRSGWRETNGVEIMMPGFSKRALWKVLPLFNYTISGFGLDFLISKIARECNLTTGVIDKFPVFHSKEINQADGAYYNYLRQFGINSKTELWYLVEAFSLDLGFCEV